jgi:hypothetical protein
MVLMQKVEMEIPENDLPDYPKRRRFVSPAESVLWMAGLYSKTAKPTVKPASMGPTTS